MSTNFRRKIQDFIPAINFEIDHGISIEFITFDREIQEFHLNEECMSFLLKSNQNIAFVLNMGEMCIEKNEVYNNVLGLSNKEGFQANHPGIYLWTEPIYKPQTDTNIYLLDIQGFKKSGILIEQK